MAPSNSSLTKEDLRLMLALGKRVLEAKFGHLKEAVIQNYHEAIDPDTRLAGRIRAKYDALVKADFSHEEAMEYTSKSVSRTVEATLNALKKTENPQESKGE